MNLYLLGILFTLGYQFGGLDHHKDTWGNALLTGLLAIAFPFYWGLTLSMILHARSVER